MTALQQHHPALTFTVSFWYWWPDITHPGSSLKVSPTWTAPLLWSAIVLDGVQSFTLWPISLQVSVPAAAKLSWGEHWDNWVTLSKSAVLSASHAAVWWLGWAAPSQHNTEYVGVLEKAPNTCLIVPFITVYYVTVNASNKTGCWMFVIKMQGVQHFVGLSMHMSLRTNHPKGITSTQGF